jgi:hypothetical protein
LKQPEFETAEYTPYDGYDGEKMDTMTAHTMTARLALGIQA